MQNFPLIDQEKSAFGGSEIWNSQPHQRCRGRQGHPCKAQIQSRRKIRAGKGSWASPVLPCKHHPSRSLDSPRKYWEILKQTTTLPSFLSDFFFFKGNGRDDQEAEPVLQGCLRIPMVQTSPEDSNHLKTPETANPSLVVWGEQSLSPSINTLQALLAKISPWAGYFWHSAQSRAADRHCTWLSAVENSRKYCKSV